MDCSKLDPQGPPLSKEYLEGGTAYNNAKDVTDNPYLKGTPEHDKWECGYCDAEGYEDFINGRIGF